MLKEISLSSQQFVLIAKSGDRNWQNNAAKSKILQSLLSASHDFE